MKNSLRLRNPFKGLLCLNRAADPRNSKELNQRGHGSRRSILQHEDGSFMVVSPNELKTLTGASKQRDDLLLACIDRLTQWPKHQYMNGGKLQDADDYYLAKKLVERARELGIWKI